MERTLVPAAGVQSILYRMAAPTSWRGIAWLTLALLRIVPAVARMRPRATFATGGYVSIPASIASWLCRVPLVVFLPDVVPGKAVSVLVPLARRIAVSSEDALAYLPARKTIVTGYPVREAFLDTSSAMGRRHFAIPEDAVVLAVFGGSLGARHINQALAGSLASLLESYYVLHICGEQRMVEANQAAARLSPEQRTRYLLYPYLHDPDIAHALAAADLAVCRSGASVLGELPAVGTPAVLVPLPIPGVHQRENAEYLARHGAAVVLEDERVETDLGGVLHGLLGDPRRLREMEMAARALARPDAAKTIATIVREVAR